MRRRQFSGARAVRRQQQKTFLSPPAPLTAKGAHNKTPKASDRTVISTAVLGPGPGVPHSAIHGRWSLSSVMPPPSINNTAICNCAIVTYTRPDAGRAAPHLAIVRRFSRSQGSDGMSRRIIDKPATTTRQTSFWYLSIPPSGAHEPAAPRHVTHERGAMRIIRAGCNTNYSSAIRIIDCSS